MEWKFNPHKPILRFIKYVTVYIAIVFLLFYAYFGYFPDNIFFAIGLLIVLEIPVYILFFQYYFHDRKAEFIWEKGKNHLLLIKGESKLEYSIDEITKIELTATAAKLRKNTLNIFWNDDFFNYKFHFRDGSSIIITSVILNWKLINEANFKNLPLTKKAKFFSFL